MCWMITKQRKKNLRITQLSIFTSSLLTDDVNNKIIRVNFRYCVPIPRQNACPLGIFVLCVWKDRVFRKLYMSSFGWQSKRLITITKWHTGKYFMQLRLYTHWTNTVLMVRPACCNKTNNKHVLCPTWLQSILKFINCN